MSKAVALTKAETADIRELLLVAAIYLRYLADDVGPRQPSAMLKDTLRGYVDKADTLRARLGAL